MDICKTNNPIKNYDWGSVDFIPRLLAVANPEKKPFAEIWMGAHPASPSTVIIDGKTHTLLELIEKSPEKMIGKRCGELFGRTLPFLFKLLAAEKPLSIQAHPDMKQASEGWQRENEAGIPIDAVNRNYKDANHKPEILCALTPFNALCGFRPVNEICRLLDIFDAPMLKNVREALENPDAGVSLSRFLYRLNSLTTEQKKELGFFARKRAENLKTIHQTQRGMWDLVEYLSVHEIEDAAIIAPLFLNYLELSPGQAIFLPAGILHAYVSGFGVELMANSDNVLRGGLTKKHVDTDELLRVLRFEPYNPPILSPGGSRFGEMEYYDTPAAEFRLYRFRTEAAGESRPLPASTPSIVVTVEGVFDVRGGSTAPIRVKKGESVFIAASAASPSISGSGLAYIASVPT